MSGFSVLTLLLVSRMVMSTCGQDYSDQYDVASVIDPGDLPVLSENVVQTEPRQQQEVLPLLTQDSEVGAVVAAEDMCRVSTGESNIVLDLEESRGTDYSQKTRPRELPILGEVGRDINLELVFPTGYTIFTLQDKSLHLTEPLDRDESDLSSAESTNHFITKTKVGGTLKNSRHIVAGTVGLNSAARGIPNHEINDFI